MRIIQIILPLFLFSPSVWAQSIVDIAPILKSSAEKSVKAEKIAREAEKMVHPVGFPFALELFKVSLQLDPKNKLAAFYSNYVEILMKMQGLHKRLAPLMAVQSTKAQKKFEKVLKDIRSPSLLQFISMARSNIYSERDLMDVVVSTQGSVEKLRQFLLDNPKMQLELNLALKADVKMQVQNASCTVTVLKPGEKYRLGSCLEEGRKKYKVNSADLVALRGAASGLLIAIAAAGSYELDGLINVMDQASALHLKPREVVARLQKLKSAGKLRNSKLLKTIPDFAADVVLAAKWAIKYAGTVCPKGSDSSENRPGYLFANGICINSTTVDFAASISSPAPESVVFSEWKWENDQWQESQIHSQTLPYALVANPTADLRTLLPNQFNRCGEPVGFPDPSLGGYLPKRDATRVYPYLSIMDGLNLVSERKRNYWTGQLESPCPPR